MQDTSSADSWLGGPKMQASCLTRINLVPAQTYLPRTKLVLIINTSRILTSDISNIIQIKSNYMYISRTSSQKLNLKVYYILKIKTTILNLHLHYLFLNSFLFFLLFFFASSSSFSFSSFTFSAYALKLFIKTLIYVKLL